MGMFAKRVPEAPKGGLGVGYPHLKTDAKKFPELVEFLTLELFADGSARDLGTVRFMVEGGRLKACLNDDAEGRYAFVCLGSLETFVGDLEALLEKGELDWRHSKGNGARKK